MSDLGRRLLDDMTGGEGEMALGSVADQVEALVSAFGSQRRAAAATGFARTTFYRWAKGATPKGATLAKLARAVRATRLDPDRPRTDIELTLMQRGGKKDGQERTVDATNLGLAEGTLDRVAEAYVATGDPEVMARVFVGGVTVGFYRSWLARGLDPVTGPADGGGKAGGGGAGDDDDADDDDVWDDDDYEYAEIDELYEADADPSEGDYVFDAA